MTPSISADDIQRRFDRSPMSWAQYTAMAVPIVLSALDGYDTLAVAFAVPAIVRAWHIGSAQSGLILSIGLAGMAAGSFFLARWQTSSAESRCSWLAWRPWRSAC